MDDNIHQFDKYIEQRYDESWNIPGVSIVIFDKDNIIYSKSIGYSNIIEKKKLKITDKFCIASCSKSIFCLAITRAILDKYIPDIWNMYIGDIITDYDIHPDYKSCKIIYLAQHTSGISDMRPIYKYSRLLYSTYGNIPGLESRRLITEFFLTRRPIYPVNSKFDYSNIGYGVLGHIIEKITKKDYSDIIDRYVFNDLDIKADYHDYQMGPGYAEGHYNEPNFNDDSYKVLEKNQHINPSYESPAGDMYINPIDFSKYCQCLLKLDDRTKGIITKKNLNDYGLGLYINNDNIDHSGGYFYTASYFKVYPDKNIGFLFSMNCMNYSAGMDIQDGILKFFINNTR